MKKPWGGRFRQETSKETESFTESVSFDKRLWRHDIEGSIAHAKMLGKQGIISRSESDKIVKGLLQIAGEIENGTFKFRIALEDVHMNIEAALIEKIGPVGGKLHTARSRNDQVALDLRLYLRAETGEIVSLIKSLSRVIIRSAEKNIDAIMPGYTHLQRAQPVLLAHHLLAYVEMLSRDADRFSDCLKRIDVMPLGSCALSGTGLPIDRKYAARLLGFKSLSGNSIDAVSDRDFVVEFLSVSSVCMMHLSRLSEELILWSTEEFSFIELPDAYTTGSSIMPQKKNPDVAELIRGKTGRLYGNLFAVLTIMKALPLSYNRDLQEDKPPLFDAIDTLKGSLRMLTKMLPAVKYRKARMLDSASGGFSLATEVADYLVIKGLPFRAAHEAAGKAVRYCMDKNKNLEDLSIDEFRAFSPLIGKDIYSRLTVEASVKAKNIDGGTSPEQVKKRLKHLEKARK